MLPLLCLLAAGAMAQDLTCPTGVTNPNTFYIIGASGGDSTVTYIVANHRLKMISSISEAIISSHLVCLHYC